MAKKYKNNHFDKKRDKDIPRKPEKRKEYLLTLKTKKWIKAISAFLVAIIITLSFFDKSGMAGRLIVSILKLLFGDAKTTIVTIVLSLFLSGFLILKSHKKVKILAILLAIITLVVGISGVSSNQNINEEQVGLIGWIAKVLVNLFGLLVANIVFSSIILIGLFIFLQFIWHEIEIEKEEKKQAVIPTKSSDSPNLRIKGLEDQKPEALNQKASLFRKPNGLEKEKKPALIHV